MIMESLESLLEREGHGQACILERSVWPTWRAHWTGWWETSLNRGRGSGHRVKGAGFFRWDAPQVLVSIGLEAVEEEFGIAPRIWPGLGSTAGRERLE